MRKDSTGSVKILRPVAALFVSVLMGAVLLSCATVPKEKVEAPKLSQEEQKERAYVKFNEMLEVTKNVRRTTVMDKIEEGYLEIIDKYPDTDLAEESYYRLIKLYNQDFFPARPEDAEEIYRLYFERYSEPKVGELLNDTMARHYFTSEQWVKLLSFVTPYVKRFIETKKLKGPLYLFFYSEAKYNLNVIGEAEKGYRLLIQHFPKSHEARLSGKRLKKIKYQKVHTGVTGVPSYQPDKGAK